MVFNATFNNISVISWLSVLLVEDMLYEAGYKVKGASQSVPITIKVSSNSTHDEV
jgi:hypothetical protein